MKVFSKALLHCFNSLGLGQAMEVIERTILNQLAINKSKLIVPLKCRPYVFVQLLRRPFRICQSAVHKCVSNEALNSVNK